MRFRESFCYSENTVRGIVGMLSFRVYWGFGTRVSRGFVIFYGMSSWNKRRFGFSVFVKLRKFRGVNICSCYGVVNGRIVEVIVSSRVLLRL